MTLQRHILMLVAMRILAALVILLSILQILDLLDVTTDILERQLGVGGVIYYSLLRVPAQLEQVAPLAVLAGCLFAFGQLARENAVIALRSSGMPVYRLVVIAAPAAAAIAALHILASLWGAPYAQQALDSWWAASTPAADRVAKEPRSFRVGSDIVVATMADDAGRALKEINIYRRDASGRLVQKIHADAAAYGAGGWTLTAPRLESIDPDAVLTGPADTRWAGPPPSDVQAAFSNEATLAAGQARRALDGGVSTMPATYYRTQIHRNWAAPFTALVMLLLAAPVALINPRSGGAQILVSCLASGLVFLVADGICTALGESGNVPAFLAAWTAPALFAAAGASVLLRMEQ